MNSYHSEEDPRIASLMEAYDIYSSNNDFNRSLQIAEELVEVRGQAQDWSVRGFCQSALGDFEGAIESLSRSITLDRADGTSWNNLGGIFNSIGRYEEALLCFDKVLELSPIDVFVLANKATTLSNFGYHVEALTVFDRLLKLDPTVQVAWTNRGLALGNLDRNQEAADSFNKALELDPSDEVALVHLGRVLMKDRYYDDALEAFNQAIALAPNNAEYLIGQGSALGNLGSYNKALKSFEQAVKLDPMDSGAWFGQSIILGEIERYEEALASCDKSIELGCQDAAAFLNRAKALLAMDRWDDGTIALDDALNRLNSEANNSSTRDTEAIVRNLLQRMDSVLLWRSSIKTLIDIYSKHQAISVLEEGLIQSISVLISPLISEDVARTWRDIWWELVSDCSELQTPLHLLSAAIKYRETKGDPHVFLELSTRECELFKSLLGVEQPSNHLNEAELIWRAGCLALSGYELLGRGVVWFDGEKPHYVRRQENMPEELLAQVDLYEPNHEFLLIPSNHSSIVLLEFSAIGLDPKVGKERITEEMFNQELEAVLTLLRENGLEPRRVDSLRQMIITYHRGEFSLAGYPSEVLEVVQRLFEELAYGDRQLIINSYINGSLLETLELCLTENSWL